MGFNNVNGSAVTPRVASAAMAMVTARTEQNSEIVGFSNTLVKLEITANMKLDQMLQIIERYPMGGTDCAQPMVWAKDRKKLFDVFIVYTDCETWAGRIHPTEALIQFRMSSGIWNSKLIVCAMTATEVSLADPNDPGMMDMTGFDSSAPEIMRNFTLGLI
jgi:60 kDa SS-A/Ro ribonucleoprotein